MKSEFAQAPPKPSAQNKPRTDTAFVQQKPSEAAMRKMHADGFVWSDDVKAFGSRATGRP